jgi:hypothetical protein
MATALTVNLEGGVMDPGSRSPASSAGSLGRGDGRRNHLGIRVTPP